MNKYKKNIDNKFKVIKLADLLNFLYLCYDRRFNVDIQGIISRPLALDNFNNQY